MEEWTGQRQRGVVLVCGVREGGRVMGSRPAAPVLATLSGGGFIFAYLFLGVEVVLE